MPVDHAAIAAQMDRLSVMMRKCDEAQMTLYNTVMSVNKRDPRLTAAMRQCGILPQMSAFFQALGDMTSQISPLLRMLEEAAKEQ